MIQNGVKIYGLRPELVYCHIFVEKVFARHGIDCIPTSVTGKKHGSLSLHPVGYAEDIKTKHIMGSASARRDVIDAIVADLKKELPCCDIVLEHYGHAQEHIHVEYDPKDDLVFQQHKAKYRLSGTWPK